MENKAITVDVKIDDKAFRSFAVFEMFRRQRKWITSVIFTLILTVSACICFYMSGKVEGAVMLGCVLLAVGWGVPALFLNRFFRSINAQIKLRGLTKPQPAYSLRFSDEPEGVTVSNPAGESAVFSWDNLYGAYRVDGYTYFYAHVTRAFILPDNHVLTGPDALWSLFNRKMPAAKLHDWRKIKK